MYMNPDAYFKRLQAALEKIVAPEIDDDHVRGQLYAVSELIGQMVGKLEYKQSVAGEDADLAIEALGELLAGLEQGGVIKMPDWKGPLRSLDELISEDRLAGAEEMLSEAIEVFFQARGQLDDETAERIDKELRDYLTKQATREIGRVKPPQLDKISRSKKPERQ